MAKASRTPERAPDQRPLTRIQAARLGALAKLDHHLFEGLTVAEIRDKFGWQVDARWLLFRRLCGRVVKKDPITGELLPVPFATVTVQDTDCGLISYFPGGWPWGWFFPFFCRREDIATVKTDKCGNFCVWVPRFEIDWILTWRKTRICFPDIFVRPNLRDLLPLEPVRPVPPRPGPDPEPFTPLTALPAAALEAIGGPVARGLKSRLVRLAESRTFGAPAADVEALSNQRAFDHELPPPLPPEFRKALAQSVDVRKAGQAVDAHAGIRSAVALHLQRGAADLEGFDVSRFIGPFFRCRDVYIPEWHLITDVPDITFKVTQDIDGDGDEEVIYSEGYFDVRWNAGAIPDVTLLANDHAIASRACDVPVVPCGNVPAIVFAGLMPLDTPYFDKVEGYALRPNKPIPVADAKTPFCGTLQLYGCVNLPGAVYYRVQRSTDNGATFSPVVNLPRVLHPSGGGAPWTETPADGWYTVASPAANWHPANMLIEWPTPAIGKSVFRVEIGDAGKNSLATSATVAIQVDNTAPAAPFTKLNWKFASEPDSAFTLPGRNLLVPCPTIRRGAIPADIEVEFEVSVTAAHLRNAYLTVSGCGGGSFTLVGGSPPNHVSHWHDSVTDNAEVLTGRYALSHTALEGSYGFGCVANSRAMNPAGSDNGHLSDWNYNPVYIYSNPSLAVSIVNA